MYTIPVYRPSLSGREREYVNQCLDSSWISSKGSFIQKFEQGFAAYIGSKQATSVSNGTVALHLSLVALGIGPGDEVIVPTFTYIASVNAIAYTGATPIFVDSDPETWQIDPKEVERKLSPRTKAIMAVHLYGHPCDMDALCAIAKANRLFLVEDCAEAFGTLYRGRHVGTFGDIATFSFYGNKTITTGEGGMVVTDDETLLARTLQFKGQGLAKYREYWHDVVGYNYRMTNLCAAIGLAQLEQADAIIEKKLQIARWYDEFLAEMPLITHRPVGDVRHSYWMYSVLVPSASQREPVRESLKEAGIETRPTFYPVHTMPMYSARYEKHRHAEDIGWRGMNLPSYPDLTRDDVAYIANTLGKALARHAP